MKKIAIMSTGIDHGKKIIQYLISLGAENKCNYTGKSIGGFYFISEKNGNIDISLYFNDLPNGYEVVGLPIEGVSEPKRGDEIWVSDTIDGNHEKRIFLAYIEGAKSPVVTVAKGDESNFKQGKPFSTVQWRYCKKIEEEQIVELTMEDISNGKGVGIKPELIRIKK